jgi:thiol-disulfide isomerase/thioredoxin
MDPLLSYTLARSNNGSGRLDSNCALLTSAQTLAEYEMKRLTITLCGCLLLCLGCEKAGPQTNPYVAADDSQQSAELQPPPAEPISEAAATETPAAETAAETPVADVAVAEVPAAEVPAAEVPAAEVPAEGEPAAFNPEDFTEGGPEIRERLAELEQSQQPPALEVDQWINSEPLTLADLKGKIVVLDFWATWCGPCLRSVPHTNEMAEKYGDDVVIIGICNKRGAEKMQETALEHGIKYPIAIDVNGNTVESYRVNGYPDYYLIDRNGKLRVADCFNSLVDDAIEALLAEETL